MASLAGIIGYNSMGFLHKLGKVDRAILASSNRLLDQVLLGEDHIYHVEVSENKFNDVILGTPDVARLRNCFEYIAFGQHRHHLKQNFYGTLKLLLAYLFHKNHNQRMWVELIRDRTELDLVGKPRFGSNPQETRTPAARSKDRVCWRCL